MAIFYNAGDSIECQKSMVAVRKCTPNAPTLIKLINLKKKEIRLFKYKTNISAFVKITQQLDPLECQFCKTSTLLLNDALQGQVLSLYFEGRIKLEYQANFTNVHGIQGNNISGFTYAKIDIPWIFALNQQKAIA